MASPMSMPDFRPARTDFHDIANVLKSKAGKEAFEGKIEGRIVLSGSHASIKFKNAVTEMLKCFKKMSAEEQHEELKALKTNLKEVSKTTQFGKINQIKAKIHLAITMIFIEQSINRNVDPAKLKKLKKLDRQKVVQSRLGEIRTSLDPLKKKLADMCSLIKAEKTVLEDGKSEIQELQKGIISKALEDILHKDKGSADMKKELQLAKEHIESYVLELDGDFKEPLQDAVDELDRFINLADLDPVQFKVDLYETYFKMISDSKDSLEVKILKLTEHLDKIKRAPAKEADNSRFDQPANLNKMHILERNFEMEIYKNNFLVKISVINTFSKEKVERFEDEVKIIKKIIEEKVSEDSPDYLKKQIDYEIKIFENLIREFEGEIGKCMAEEARESFMSIVEGNTSFIVGSSFQETKEKLNEEIGNIKQEMEVLSEEKKKPLAEVVEEFDKLLELSPSDFKSVVIAATSEKFLQKTSGSDESVIKKLRLFESKLDELTRVSTSFTLSPGASAAKKRIEEEISRLKDLRSISEAGNSSLDIKKAVIKRDAFKKKMEEADPADQKLLENAVSSLDKIIETKTAKKNAHYLKEVEGFIWNGATTVSAALYAVNQSKADPNLVKMEKDFKELSDFSFALQMKFESVKNYKEIADVYSSQEFKDYSTKIGEVTKEYTSNLEKLNDFLNKSENRELKNRIDKHIARQYKTKGLPNLIERTTQGLRSHVLFLENLSSKTPEGAQDILKAKEICERALDGMSLKLPIEPSSESFFESAVKQGPILQNRDKAPINEEVIFIQGDLVEQEPLRRGISGDIKIQEEDMPQAILENLRNEFEAALKTKDFSEVSKDPVKAEETPDRVLSDLQKGYESIQLDDLREETAWLQKKLPLDLTHLDIDMIDQWTDVQAKIDYLSEGLAARETGEEEALSVKDLELILQDAKRMISEIGETEAEDYLDFEDLKFQSDEELTQGTLRTHINKLNDRLMNLVIEGLDLNSMAAIQGPVTNVESRLNDGTLDLETLKSRLMGAEEEINKLEESFKLSERPLVEVDSFSPSVPEIGIGQLRDAGPYNHGKIDDKAKDALIPHVGQWLISENPKSGNLELAYRDVRGHFNKARLPTQGTLQEFFKTYYHLRMEDGVTSNKEAMKQSFVDRMNDLVERLKKSESENLQDRFSKLNNGMKEAQILNQEMKNNPEYLNLDLLDPEVKAKLSALIREYYTLKNDMGIL